MIPLLTQYLLLYKKVSIPEIGTLELVPASPQYLVVDHVFTPPTFTTLFTSGEQVSDHQFQFFQAASGSEDLLSFGDRLRKSLSAAPYRWAGFGTLSVEGERVRFESESLNLPALAPVPARKVHRENVQHRHLVGDTHMSSEQVSAVLNQSGSRRPLMIVIGWVLFFLALMAIIILVYLGKLDPSAAGLKNSFRF